MGNWQDKLYNYGFLMTNHSDIDLQSIGIKQYDWNSVSIDAWTIWTHPLQNCFVHTKGGISFVLIGHAYNPFTMEADENAILRRLSEMHSDEMQYRNYFDQLTGVFFYAVIETGRITFTCDCAGMMGAYYGKVSGSIYCSSHYQMIADLCGLQEDPYVTRLKSSKLFRLYGWFLPGDLSSYPEVKRVIPNTEVIYDGAFRISRFYPRTQYSVCEGTAYQDTVKKAGEILHNSMVLIAEKWENPAVSLTGGTDSKTTLACASDVQSRFEYFSYISLPREATDADAAAEMCRQLGLHHTIFKIDTDPTAYPEFDEVNRLVERHYGYLGKGNSNDVCKRIGLAKILPYDVEVKSWVSEIARASRYEIYKKRDLPKRMTPRILTTMYKVFAFNRRTALETDRIFKTYMESTGLRDAVEKNCYPWSEFFVWEIVFGGWGGLALTGEHKLTNDITVPYNNRALLDMMLRTPLQARRTDQLHRDIMDAQDPRINQMGIHVVNGNSTALRAVCERIYFDVHRHLPF